MMKIIPAIDLIDGQCVRLTHGDYDTKKVYHTDPVVMAMEFEQTGIDRLHLVDLDGAKAGAVKNLRVLEAICSRTRLIVDFGGGITTEEILNDVFNAGASLATIGSIAVKKPEVFRSWVQKFGGDRIFLGADAKDRKIAVSGWLEQTEIDLFDFVEQHLQLGIRQMFCTDIAKDGALMGPSIELYKDLISRFPSLRLTASGGVSNLNDLHGLRDIGCDGAIVGKAIYEGRIKLNELEEFLC